MKFTRENALKLARLTQPKVKKGVVFYVGVKDGKMFVSDDFFEYSVKVEGVKPTLKALEDFYYLAINGLASDITEKNKKVLTDEDLKKLVYNIYKLSASIGDYNQKFKELMDKKYKQVQRDETVEPFNYEIPVEYKGKKAIIYGRLFEGLSINKAYTYMTGVLLSSSLKVSYAYLLNDVITEIVNRKNITQSVVDKIAQKYIQKAGIKTKEELDSLNHTIEWYINDLMIPSSHRLLMYH